MIEVPFHYAVGFAALFGATIGSFLNVVIHRVPLGQSVVRPRSRCPQCDWTIPAWANIPILSYAALGGRCWSCKARISLRYPLVEALTAAIFVTVLLVAPSYTRLIAHWALAAALIAIAFIDLDHQIIPNSITYPGIVLGLALSFFSSPPVPLDAFLGALVPAGMMFVIAEIYERRRGEIGLGMGDVKLVAMLGAFLGLQAGFGIMVLGSLLGLLHGLGMMLFAGAGRRTRIPFGPALCLAGLLHIYDPLLFPGLLERIVP